MTILQIAGASPGEGDGGPVPASGLRALGHTVDVCLAALSDGNGPAALQVERTRPDVLWVGDAVRFDARFLASLAWRPRRVVGWSERPPLRETDWTGFDLVLLGDTLGQEQTGARGARRVAAFGPPCPGGPEDGGARRWDIVFRGHVPLQPGCRLNALRELAKAPLGLRGEFEPAFFLSGPGTAALPSGLHLYNQGELPVRALPGVMAHARTAVLFQDEPPETAEPFVLAALSAGALLLAEQGAAAERLFEPGQDFLRFGTPAELVDLLYAHKNGSGTADAVIRQGGRRCWDTHGPAARAMAFAARLAVADR